MIKVNYFQNELFIESVIVSGHANFLDYGKDIVCSGVSSVVFGSFSFLQSYLFQFVNCTKNKNEVTFFQKSFNEEVNLCFKIMIHQLKNIEKFYPDFISVSEKIKENTLLS